MRECWTVGGAFSTGLCDCAHTAVNRHNPIHSSSLLLAIQIHAGFLGLFLPLLGHTDWGAVWEDLRVLTVLGSSCPLSGFSPVQYAKSMVGAWMYWECTGCGLNFLETAAPLWAPFQTWVSVQMDSTCITIYSELMCPSMCWPSVFPLHLDFWAPCGVCLHWRWRLTEDSLTEMVLFWCSDSRGHMWTTLRETL